uniref:Expressed protein n=1 Tax=Schizophyllum commune (strain H4-8 / FGSC 9210) TaxID=578458 RepID=D8Q465_SCHCM
MKRIWIARPLGILVMLAGGVLDDLGRELFKKRISPSSSCARRGSWEAPPPDY